jgi:hypothetical protein
VLRNADPGHTEVGIVLGPSPHFADSVEVLHGWIDQPPDCGVWDQCVAELHPRAWRVATEAEAATVRVLFLAHAKAWGDDSLAWVAAEVPSVTTEPCDVHGNGDGTRPSLRCERCSRFAFLCGYAMRTDEEEAEVHAIAAWHKSIGVDTGWTIVPRESIHDAAAAMRKPRKARKVKP